MLLSMSCLWATSPKMAGIESHQLAPQQFRTVSGVVGSNSATIPADVRDIRNGNYALACTQENGGYLPNMLNYLTGPEIQIPAGSVVQFDFACMGNFSDPDAFPNVDYWGCELTVDGGDTWYYVSNPYGDPNGNNYVYSDAPAEWTSSARHIGFRARPISSRCCRESCASSSSHRSAAR